MAIDVATLAINVDTTQMDKATRSMSKFQRQAKTTQRSTQKMSKGFDGLKASIAPIGALLGGLGLALIGRQFVDVTRKIQDFRSTMVAVTGSTAEYERQMALLEKVTKTLPLGMENTEKAFANLNANGIRPSLSLMTSFANAASITQDKAAALESLTRLWTRASAKGKIELDLLNSVAEKNVDVFAILRKELGLNGDEITEFASNAKNTKIVLDAIEAGLQKGIFKGAAEADMKTLDTQLQKLNDNWVAFLRALGDASGAANGFSAVLQGLNATLEFLTENADVLLNILIGIGSAAVVAGIYKTVKALKALKYAIASTGVGALVVGFGLLVTALLEGYDALNDWANEWGEARGKSITAINTIQATWSVMVENMFNAWAEFTITFGRTWDAIVRQIQNPTDFTFFEDIEKAFQDSKVFQSFEGTQDRILQRMLELGVATKDALSTEGTGQTGGAGTPTIDLFGKDRTDDYNTLVKTNDELIRLVDAARQGEAALLAERDAIAIEIEAFKIINSYREEGIELTKDQTNFIWAMAASNVELANTLNDLENSWDKQKTALEEYADQLRDVNGALDQATANGFKGLEDAFVSILDGSQSAGDAFRSFANGVISDMIRIAVQQAIIKPLLTTFGFTFADGAAFSGGSVVPFATGGVVAGPTTFPMSGGRTGLMGEAGPEAIMPLSRGADGSLGVQAIGGTGAADIENNFNVTVNVDGAAGGDSEQNGELIGKAVTRQLENLVTETLRKQLRPGNLLNPVNVV